MLNVKTRRACVAPVIICLVGLCILAASGCSRDAGREAGPRPDVVIITLDTTRADFLGCYGNPDVKTPNLDAFARDGALFTNCFSTANSTNPSHTSILTSLYMRDHGVLDNKHALPEYPGFMPRLFGAAGYRTAAFTSGGHLDRTVNINQGFDDFTCPEDGYETTAAVTTELALEWLDTRIGKSGEKAGPFMLWVHYFDPHFMYQPPPPYDTMYKGRGDTRIDWAMEYGLKGANRKYMAASADPEHFRNLYKGEVSFMDAQLGRVLARLKQMGRYDSSIIVVVADHGESLGEHGIFWDHAGLYDTTIRVPLMIKPAGDSRPGIRGQLVSTVDVYPTILEIAGITADNPVMGNSLVGVLGNPDSPDPRNEAYFQSVFEDFIGIRTPEYTYIRRVRGRQGLDGSAGMGGHSAIVELYDNDKDPDQLINIAALRPEVTSYFEKRAGAFINDRAYARKAEEITDKPHLEKLKALGYVQ